MNTDQVTQTAGTATQGGWFGNITNNLATLTNSAAGFVTALNTNGGKVANANASGAAAGTAAAAVGVKTEKTQAGMTQQMKVIIALAVAVLAGVAFLLLRKPK